MYTIVLRGGSIQSHSGYKHPKKTITVMKAFKSYRRITPSKKKSLRLAHFLESFIQCISKLHIIGNLWMPNVAPGPRKTSRMQPSANPLCSRTEENWLDLRLGGDGALRRNKPGSGASEGRRERSPEICLGSSDSGHHPAAVGRSLQTLVP